MTDTERINALEIIVRKHMSSLETLNARMEILRRTLESACRMLLAMASAPADATAESGETVVAGGFIFDAQRLAAVNGALRLAVATRTGSDPGPVHVGKSETYTPEDLQLAITMLETVHPQWKKDSGSSMVQ